MYPGGAPESLGICFGRRHRGNALPAFCTNGYGLDRAAPQLVPGAGLVDSWAFFGIGREWLLQLQGTSILRKKALLLKNKMHRFLLGLVMSALNPVQIPFWFLWTSTFIQTKILPVNALSFNLFTIGAGAGTIGGLAVYIHGGNWLVTRMNTSNKTLNKIMGVIFIITALIQLYRMLYKPWI
jgi:threonine/homoserine/homoserine lactone efflux protein